MQMRKIKKTVAKMCCYFHNLGIYNTGQFVVSVFLNGRSEQGLTLMAPAVRATQQCDSGGWNNKL